MAVLTALGAVYNYFGILPGDARLWAMREASALTKKKISFTKAVWLPFTGFTFYDLDVREKNDARVFSAKRLGLDVKLVPFLREKKIVLNNVLLDEPVIDYALKRPRIVVAPKPVLKTEISGQIRVPSVDDERKVRYEDIVGGPESFLPENVYIEQIQIVDGQLTIRPAQNEPPLEMIRDIRVKLAFRRPPVLRFDGSLTLGENVYATVNLTGSWDLAKAQYEFQLLTTWEQVPDWLKAYQQNHFLVLRDGRVKLATKLQSVGEEKALFYANADLRDAEIRIRDGEYRGHLKVGAKGLFNFLTKRVERYKGTLDLVDVVITNLTPKIYEIRDVQGQVDFQPDLLTVKSFKGVFADVPFNAAGTLTGFKTLVVQGRIYTRIGIAKLLSLIPPEQKRLVKDYVISGECEANTILSGSLKDPGGVKASYQVSLRSGTVTSPDRKWRIGGVSGDLSTSEAGLEAKNVRFEFDQKRYEIDAFVPKQAGAMGRLAVRSQDVALRTSYAWREGHVDLENAQALLPGLALRFGGALYPSGAPVLDVHGHADADLRILTKSHADKAVWLKSWPLDGKLSGDFRYKGIWNRPAFAEIGLDMHGHEVAIKKARLQNPVVSAVVKNGELNVAHLNAKAYGGMLGFKGVFDFKDPETAFDADFYANDVDVHALMADVAPEDKKRAGDMVLQLSLQGKLKDASTYKGGGVISVKNGYIMETTQFKAMGNLPLVRVEGLDLVVFHEMTGAFKVKEKRIWTDRLALRSETVNLDLRGSVGFMQDLDMLMDIEYTNAVFLGAQDAGGLAPYMVNQAQDLIGQYHVGGTLKKPKYEKAGPGVVTTIGKKVGEIIGGIVS